MDKTSLDLMVRRCQAARAAGRRLGGERGYTLVELLIVLVILLVVLGALVDGFASASHTEVDQEHRATDQQSARQALDRMRKDIHCATSANIQQVITGGVPTQAWIIDLPIPVGCLVDLPSTDSSVQWCTAPINGSATRYGLYRTFETQPGTSCDAANAEFQVDYVTRPQIWTLPACAAGQVKTVAVDLPVNRDIVKNAQRTYNLQDSIALRNAGPC
jgi:prepilin-type N-terminal cleavage/methylation domain-containing protein